jgi:hypothetical protein
VKPLGVGDLHCRESTRPFEDILCSLPRRILTRKANSNGWLMAGEPDNATTLVPLAASSRSYRANLTFCYVSLLRGVGQSTGQVVDFIDYDKGIVKG